MEISFTPNDRGQVGIGTLIVFIAMVLVAAIAAGVLINTAGFLQTQAEDTGTESTEQVASNLNVITTVGDVSSSGDTIDEIQIGVQPAAGSDDLNLEELSIQYVADESFSNLVHVQEADTDGANTVFNTEAVTAEDGTDNVMTDNSDRYEIVVPLDQSDPFTYQNPTGLDGSDDPATTFNTRFDLVIPEDVITDAQGSTVENVDTIADRFENLEQSDIVEVEVTDSGGGGGQYQDARAEGAQLVVDSGTADSGTFSGPGDISAITASDIDTVGDTSNIDNIQDGDSVVRVTAYVDGVDYTELAGVEEGGGYDTGDEIALENYNHPDNTDLTELQEGEEAELTFTTETGAQTQAILQVPDSLAGEDEDDTVDL